MRHSAALCQRCTCFKAVKPIYVNIRLIFIQGFIVSKQEKEENMFIHLYIFFKNQRNVAGCLVDVLQGLHSNAEHKATADPNWIGNVTPGKPFPRQLFSAASEVKTTRKEKRRRRKKKNQGYSANKRRLASLFMLQTLHVNESPIRSLCFPVLDYTI